MSLFHWLIVLIVVIVLFGAGRIPRLAEDMAKGIKAFRSGIRDEDKPDDKKIPAETNSDTQPKP